jgi:hypothetical protein
MWKEAIVVYFKLWLVAFTATKMDNYFQATSHVNLELKSNVSEASSVTIIREWCKCCELRFISTFTWRNIGNRSKVRYQDPPEYEKGRSVRLTAITTAIKFSNPLKHMVAIRTACFNVQNSIFSHTVFVCSASWQNKQWLFLWKLFYLRNRNIYFLWSRNRWAPGFKWLDTFSTPVY